MTYSLLWLSGFVKSALDFPQGFGAYHQCSADGAVDNVQQGRV